VTLRAVIFDVGGVLVHVEDLSGHRKWEARLGLEDGGLVKAVYWSEISARASAGLATEAEVWEQVAAPFGLSAAEVGELRQDFAAGERLDAAWVPLLRALRPRYKIALLSNAWPRAREVFTRKFGLNELVDAMVISAEEGVSKPNPRIYQLATSRLDVQPEEALFIDDYLPNVAAAKALGMRGVHCTTTAQAIAELGPLLGA
jgi:putative hydrolase of the HAD superfamily